jgi:RNA polymerase sigma-70 factor (ECF subfamily)
MEFLSKNRNFSSSEASKLKEDKFIEGLKNKEEWAYRELISRWSDKLYRIALRFVHRQEEAQEIVQETFQKVIEKIHTFKGEAKFYTWLYRITVNQGLMRIRSNQSQRFISWDEILPQYQDGIYLEAASDWSKLPDAKLEEKEARQFIQNCIEELPEEYKAAYLLKDVEQLSEDEVSETLGISKVMMKMRVHRARLFLRKKLEEKFLKDEK